MLLKFGEVISNMKKLNDTATGSTLVVIVFISLLFSTVLISWFMLQIYGVTIAGIGLPAGNYYYSSNQDFKTNTINLSTISQKGADEFIYQSGIGRVLLTKTNGYYFSDTWNYLLINNIKSDTAGKIINTYHINNSVKKDYSVILRYSGGDDQIEFKIKNDGLYLPNYVGVIFAGDIYDTKLLDYPQMNQIEDVTIITNYDEEKETCEFTFNGNSYSFDNLGHRREWTGILETNYYGGVSSSTEQFTIESFTSNNVISDNADEDIISSFIAFNVIALRLVFYNISPDLLPWELNILLIKSQGIALLIGLYVLVRSGT